MIKFRRGKLIAFGLSDENLRRLKAGEPIQFNLQEIELGDYDILIFNGRTEEDMLNMILDSHNENIKK